MFINLQRFKIQEIHLEIFLDDKKYSEVSVNISFSKDIF